MIQRTIETRMVIHFVGNIILYRASDESEGNFEGEQARDKYGSDQIKVNITVLSTGRYGLGCICLNSECSNRGTCPHNIGAVISPVHTIRNIAVAVLK